MTARAQSSDLQSPNRDANGLLRAGIAAARAGQSTRARNLLMRAIDQDARNAIAWLWLSRVLHSPGGRKVCLERALALKLTSARVSRKLTQVRKRLATELLYKSVAAARSGQWKRARGLLNRAAKEYEENVLDRLRTHKAAIGSTLSAALPATARWAPVAFILAGTMVVCVSLLVAGSVMAHAAPSTGTTPAHQSARSGAVQVKAPKPTPYPTWTPTPAPTAVEPTVQAIPPTPTPPDPTPMPYPPTRIIIRPIGIDAAVIASTLEIENVDGVPQAKWNVPGHTLAGWHETSAPLGVPGNTVISGHNWPRSAVFRDLYKLQPEDEIILFSGSVSFTYEVAEIIVLPEAGQPLEVQQENTRYIQPTEDERVTLVTCHPYGSLRDRLVIVALPKDL